MASYPIIVMDTRMLFSSLSIKTIASWFPRLLTKDYGALTYESGFISEIRDSLSFSYPTYHRCISEGLIEDDAQIIRKFALDPHRDVFIYRARDNVSKLAIELVAVLDRNNITSIRLTRKDLTWKTFPQDLHYVRNDIEAHSIQYEHLLLQQQQHEDSSSDDDESPLSSVSEVVEQTTCEHIHSSPLTSPGEGPNPEVEREKLLLWAMCLLKARKFSFDLVDLSVDPDPRILYFKIRPDKLNMRRGHTWRDERFSPGCRLRVQPQDGLLVCIAEQRRV